MNDFLYSLFALVSQRQLDPSLNTNANIGMIVRTSDFTYTKPNNLRSAIVFVTGGGGVGGLRAGSFADEDGTSRRADGNLYYGGAGGTAIKYIGASDMPATVPVSVAQAVSFSSTVRSDSAGSYYFTLGERSNGESSSFGSLLTANGGTAASSITRETPSNERITNLPASPGGNSSGGDINLTGDIGDGVSLHHRRINQVPVTTGAGVAGGRSFWSEGSRSSFFYSVPRSGPSGVRSTYIPSESYGAGGFVTATTVVNRQTASGTVSATGTGGVCIIVEFLGS